MSNASHKIVDECSRFSASISAYLDGELDPAHAVDVEGHVLGCIACGERVALLRAMRLSMKRTSARCPQALRARLEAAVAEERTRPVDGARARPAGRDAPFEAAEPCPRAPGSSVDTPSHRAETSAKLMRLRYAIGLAAAAGVAFAMGMSRWTQAPTPGPTATAGVAGEDFGIDRLLDELVALHAHPFQPDTTDPDQLGAFDPLLGVRVRRPAFQPFARFQGARVHPVTDRGALLQLNYELPGHSASDGKHLTMYVFNPSVVPLRAKRLEPRMVRQRQVFMGRLRGYSVAALEQSGVGYAIASDFDTDESAKIVLSALAQQ